MQNRTDKTDISYLGKSLDNLHGDEHLVDCVGDCEIWCSCMEKQEQEQIRLDELFAEDLLRD